jgi:hypothetical protein
MRENSERNSWSGSAPKRGSPFVAEGLRDLHPVFGLQMLLGQWDHDVFLQRHVHRDLVGEGFRRGHEGSRPPGAPAS